MSFTYSAAFPATRLRRLRQSGWVRDLVAQHQLSVKDLIWPVFVLPGKSERVPVASMPGVERLSIDLLLPKVKEAQALGIPAIAIFPVIDPSLKSDDAKEAFNTNGLLPNAVRTVKDAVPDIGIICDVALDPYTSHGHDGLLVNGEIDNDRTVEALCRQAVVEVEAGCDIVAPSDMMDGRIGAIRKSLDDAGHIQAMILSYAAKYASSFYGPFRDAVGSAKNLGKADKRSYQMDPANSDEALREVALDIAEGADMVMVKPGMPYLDIVRRVADSFPIPVLAYQVSGEYAMLKAASAQGWLDDTRVMMESLLSFKRAGATAIFTYAAVEIAREINR